MTHAPNAPGADKAFLSGVEAYHRGELDVARSAFEEVLRQRPNSTGALCNLAGILGSQGDYAGAVETYDRALAIKPELAEALAGLAWALPMAGADDRMPELVRRWEAVAPDDPVARHLAASLGQRPPPSRCEGQYIESFFDGFASTYDDTLEELTYRAPEQIAAMLGEIAGEPAAGLDILDAGCGTGLCGARIHAFAKRLMGIDLSTQMLARARDREIYDELVHADLVTGMQSRPTGADVVVSADVLVYFGDLVDPFAAAKTALRPGGWLLASVEQSEDPDAFTLEETGRYQHGEAYLRSALTSAGLEPERAQTVRLRFDRGKPVSGLVFAARRS